ILAFCLQRRLELLHSVPQARDFRARPLALRQRALQLLLLRQKESCVVLGSCQALSVLLLSCLPCLELSAHFGELASVLRAFRGLGFFELGDAASLLTVAALQRGHRSS